jgi:hypothetical protein
VATACSKPPAGRARWTLELLIISFFEKDVPAAFQEAKDADALRAFDQANAARLPAVS